MQMDQQFVAESLDRAPLAGGQKPGPEPDRDRSAHPHHSQMLWRDAQIRREMALPIPTVEQVVEAVDG
jgi:hypothetical protein